MRLRPRGVGPAEAHRCLRQRGRLARASPRAGLTAEDFRVREDGVAREVLKAGPATEPLTVALLVDDSQAATPAIQMIREAMDDLHQGAHGQGRDRARHLRRAADDRRRLHDRSEEAAGRRQADLPARRAPAATCCDAIVEVSQGHAEARGRSGRSSPC